jgi:hypothetical protein
MRRCKLPSFVSTADAISKYLLNDPEWCRLSDEFHSIARDPGALGLGPGKERQLEDEARAELAKRELAKREDYLFDSVLQAVVRQELQVLLMDGYRMVQLPGLYLLVLEMADALRSGWAGKLRLTGPDTIWNGARLVFPEEDWRQWLKSQATRRDSPAAVGAVQRTEETPPMTANAGKRLPAQASDPADGAAPQSDDSSGLDRVRAVMRDIRLQRKQITRSDFNAMVRELVDPRTKAGTMDALWRKLAPDEWRRRGQGAPPAGLMVDWKDYLSTE